MSRKVKNNLPLVTAAQILEHTGIKCSKTLTRWHQLGLIPPPEIRTHPNGRGKLGYWPGWVLSRCSELHQLTGRGVGLVELKEATSRSYHLRSELPLSPEVKRARSAAKRLVRRWMGEVGSNEELMARLETMIARALLRAAQPPAPRGGRLVLKRKGS